MQPKPSQRVDPHYRELLAEAVVNRVIVQGRQRGTAPRLLARGASCAARVQSLVGALKVYERQRDRYPTLVDALPTLNARTGAASGKRCSEV
jgi:hypothetical protein